MRRGEGTGKKRRNRNNRHHISIQYTRQDLTRLSPRNITRQHDTIDRGPRLQAKPRNDKRKQDKTKGWQRRQNFSKNRALILCPQSCICQGRKSIPCQHESLSHTIDDITKYPVKKKTENIVT